ncbi:hypothetical protein FM115_01525 [Marinilactibacillus psychrotolerans 42ea]|uniref:Phage protein n=1 Tax=Marinilactibacillus psychrotolerans 42ea TaxID=1255609 RepID=A0A1R4IKH9_9LACT|nr:hypothetical protein [Marinilactibacillus psychrotolerans]SJN20357.1 hypothetical protein FM115_01525 [Marinilactibacillus psychrotolerans 42ea]
MTNYNNIKGATELVNKYKEDFKTIDDSIAELESRKVELEGKLDDSNNKFKLENIAKDAKTKHSLNLVNQYLKEAKQRKEELVKETNKNLVSEAKALVKEHAESAKHNHNDINKKIVENLYQARELQKKMNALDSLERKKINDFIADLSPYFSDESEYRKTTGGRSQTQFITHDIATKRNIFTRVPEAAYYVRGLTKPYLGAREKANLSYSSTVVEDFNKLFGVDVDEIKESIEARHVPGV